MAGGGTAKRIPLKSLKLKELIPLFECSDYRFVSLQYGDDGPHLERFYKATGIEILHDDSINPLKDMDGWLSQVAAMDAVVSIANTTVHGAGGQASLQCALSAIKAIGDGLILRFTKVVTGTISGCLLPNLKQRLEAALSETVNWLQKRFQKSIAASSFSLRFKPSQRLIVTSTNFRAI